jgi:predicted small integral membrane protein
MPDFAEIDLAWMAWTPQTALFFATILGLLLLMTALAIWRPELERVGVLGIPTTRGDRLVGLAPVAALRRSGFPLRLTITEADT